MKKYLWILIPVILVILILVGSTPKVKNWWLETQTKMEYQYLMKGQGAKKAEDILDQAVKKNKSKAIQLIIFKRTCPYCQKEREIVRKKAEELKAKGDLILVVEAPQKGIVKDYPKWVKQYFEIPQVSVPVLVEYQFKKKQDLPLTVKQTQTFQLEKGSWEYQ